MPGVHYTEMNTPIAHTLYRAFIQGSHRADRVARRLGVSARTVYKWAENSSVLPAWALAPLYSATRDLELFSDLSGATACGLVVSERPTGDDGPESVLLRMLGIGGDVGRLSDLVVRVLEDGIIDAAELQQLDRAITSIESKLCGLRSKVHNARDRVAR